MTSGLTSELELPLEAPQQQPLTIMGMELTPVRIGLLIGVAGVLVAGVIGFTQIRPLVENIDKTTKELTAKTEELNTLKAEVDRLQPLEGQIEVARRLDQDITQLLPTPENAQTQLIDLNRLLKVSDINLSSFAPQAPAALAGVPESVAAQVRQQSTRVAIQGEYSQTIQLMRNVERLKTLLRVSNLTLSVGQANPGQTPVLNMSLDLVSYIYDASAPLPTPAATPAPAQ
ncbi:MAG: hypothetical protein OHK0012_03000 [Synechococcales cyanobacterium]